MDDPIRGQLERVDREIPSPPFRVYSAEELSSLALRRTRRRLKRGGVLLALVCAGLVAIQAFGRGIVAPGGEVALPLARQVELVQRQLAALRDARHRTERERRSAVRRAIGRADQALERSAFRGVAFARTEPSTELRAARLTRIAALYPNTAGAARARRLLGKEK